MAMMLRRGRKVHFVAAIICITSQAVAAIDKHGNHYYIGTDSEIVSIASNISALQIDEPKSSGTCHFFKPLVSKLLKPPNWLQYLDGDFNISPQRY